MKRCPSHFRAAIVAALALLISIAGSNHMNVLGIILARGGSTRIPEKNLQAVGGLPLVAYSALAAREAQLAKAAARG